MIQLAEYAKWGLGILDFSGGIRLIFIFATHRIDVSVLNSLNEDWISLTIDSDEWPLTLISCPIYIAGGGIRARWE